jgi:hypothetical protein
LEWNYYCEGIYGICTLNATENEIVEKEIIVKRLIKYNEKHSESKLNEEEKEELKNLNDEFNKITSNFAPYQRETSSRGKYLDKILKINDMENLIKNYD